MCLPLSALLFLMFTQHLAFNALRSAQSSGRALPQGLRPVAKALGLLTRVSFGEFYKYTTAEYNVNHVVFFTIASLGGVVRLLGRLALWTAQRSLYVVFGGWVSGHSDATDTE